MGTRSAVGKILPDGSYDMTYIHYDGYPKGVGVTLENCVGSLQLNELLRIGHIRSLSTEPKIFNGAECEDIDWQDIKDNQRIHGSAEQFRNLHEVANVFADCDYVYVWCDNRWHVSHMRMDWENKTNWLTPFVKVSDVLAADGSFDWDALERKHMFEEIA